MPRLTRERLIERSVRCAQASVGPWAWPGRAGTDAAARSDALLRERFTGLLASLASGAAIFLDSDPVWGGEAKHI